MDVDDGQDTGLDGMAILVNGRLVTDIEELNVVQPGRLDVEFVFIQTKTSPKFDSGDIGKFLFGVRNFFGQQSAVQTNRKISSRRDLKDALYRSSINLRRAPTCRLYYATSGRWLEDPFLSGRIDSDLRLLRDTKLFSDVEFVALDAERLKTRYRELRHHIEREVSFEKHTILPKIDGAQEAYLGILPFVEFLKLITDHEGDILKSLFYDNVRDFQGAENRVNTEIESTLRDPAAWNSFVVLNNGVTIVAKEITKIGAMFRISDYQIVNGCQTSHVLHANRAHLGEGVHVPVKLVVTSHPELMNQIIKATNRQTEVKLEAFESLTGFQRQLEEFYSSMTKAQPRLYYERRSGQYAHTSILPSSIVTLAAQVKAFQAVFLADPQSTHRYYGEVLETYRDRLFQPDHSPWCYYAAGLALSWVEHLLRNGDIHPEFRRFRYHLMLLVRLKFESGDPAPTSGRRAEELGRRLCETLWDEQRTLVAFKEAQERLTKTLADFDGDRGRADRLRAFTAMFLPSARRRPRGTVKAWYDDRGFGFVQLDDGSDGKDLFVHHTALRETQHPYLRIGERVECDVVEGERGPQARDLVLVPAKRP